MIPFTLTNTDADPETKPPIFQATETGKLYHCHASVRIDTEATAGRATVCFEWSDALGAFSNPPAIVDVDLASGNDYLFMVDFVMRIEPPSALTIGLFNVTIGAPFTLTGELAIAVLDTVEAP